MLMKLKLKSTMKIGSEQSIFCLFCEVLETNCFKGALEISMVDITWLKNYDGDDKEDDGVDKKGMFQ